MAYGKKRWVNRSTTGKSRQVGKRRKPRVRRTRKNRKLLDSKINTAVEVACLRIAKKEINKNIKVWTKRNYLFHSYDSSTNVFTALAGRPDLIDWAGSVVEISNIAKMDQQTRPNVPQADDLLTGNVNENADGDGPNQLMVGVSSNERRLTEMIFVRSISAQIRVRSFQLDDDLDLFQSVKIKYAFVMVQDDEAVMADPTDKPDANELLFMSPYGYGGAKLDPVLSSIFTARKKRILCSGETILNLMDTRTSEKFHTISKKFSTPIQITYPVLDQNGQQANKKIYFISRSTIPAHSDYDGVKPSVYACTKLNWYEA